MLKVEWTKRGEKGDVSLNEELELVSSVECVDVVSVYGCVWGEWLMRTGELALVVVPMWS